MKNEQVVLEPGCGRLQGDVPMPDMFSELYERSMANWIDREANTIQANVVAIGPLTNGHIDVSNTVFADDLCETNMVEDPEDMDDVLGLSTGMLDGELETLGMTQNLDKADKYC